MSVVLRTLNWSVVVTRAEPRRHDSLFTGQSMFIPSPMNCGKVTK